MKKILVFMIIGIVLNSCCWSPGDPETIALRFKINDKDANNLFDKKIYNNSLALLYPNDTIDMEYSRFCDKDYCFGELQYSFYWRKKVGTPTAAEFLVNLNNQDYDTVKVEVLITLDKCERYVFNYAKLYYQDSVYYTERMTGTINLMKKW